jgi:Xaa-Pro aminopeptidase
MTVFQAQLCACLLVWLGVARAAGPISLDEYRSRRDALRQLLPPGSVALVAGATEAERGDIRHGFLQDADFVYLTGWREPGALAAIGHDEDVLFVPPRSEIRERYTGRKLDPAGADAGKVTGFRRVEPSTAFAAYVHKLAGGGAEFHAITPLAAVLSEPLGKQTFHALEPKLGRLRAIKSAREIELLQHSVDATVAAHKAAWRRIRSGLFEYQIAATMTGVYSERGCERNAYPPIVASGPNSVILHYAANRRRMDSGELLLMDVGAECSSYAADITRTVPVNGRFNKRQREIYDIVLGAQKAAIAAARPGMKLTGDGEDSLNRVARSYVKQFGLDKYYLHGLGHHVGLDVHDRADMSAPLEAGMVITIEPGIYIAEEGIGVRIEDVVLITPTGAKVLSGDLPKEVSAIERALRRAR